MSAFIRLHRGQYVDCYVPSSVGIAPTGAPTDVIWAFPSDVNPSKEITITQNVQASDPVSGALLFNPDGSPKWETTTVTSPGGQEITQIVTRQVQQTVYLQSAPNNFTEADFAGMTYVVVGSLADAQQNQIAALTASMQGALTSGFASTASGTSLTYNFAAPDQANMAQQLTYANAGLATWPINWPTQSGALVSLTEAQFTQLIKDAGANKWALENQLNGLIGQVQAATTPQEVARVVWS